MRTKSLLILIVLVFLSSILFWWIVSRDKFEDEVFIPEDVLALMIINQFPQNPELLEGSRLWDFFDFSAEDLSRLKKESEFSTFYTLMKDHVDRAWICIHSLQPKETGTYRIQFSAWILPVIGSRSYIQNVIRKTVQERFGIRSTQASQSPRMVILEGTEAGQILYCQELSRTLYYSNNRKARKEFTIHEKEKGTGLEDSPHYRSVIQHLPVNPDFLFYFRGFSILPEFGYAMVFKNLEMEDFYYSNAEER